MADRRFIPEEKAETLLQKEELQGTGVAQEENPWVEEGRFSYRFKQKQLGFVGLDARVFMAGLSLACFAVSVITFVITSLIPSAAATAATSTISSAALNNLHFFPGVILCFAIYSREHHARQVSFGAFSLSIWLVFGSAVNILGSFALTWLNERSLQSLPAHSVQLVQNDARPVLFEWTAYFLTDGLHLFLLSILCWQFFAAWQGKVLFLPFGNGFIYRLYKSMRPRLAWK